MKTTMSVTSDGSQIVCGGAGCQSWADASVALRPLLSSELTAVERRADGWLFVGGGGQWSHYCPLCQETYLVGLRAPAIALRDVNS